MCGQTIIIDDLCRETVKEKGHAPAQADNRFPRLGGEPSKGTKKDKRLKRNKKGRKG